MPVVREDAAGNVVFVIFKEADGPRFFAFRCFTTVGGSPVLPYNAEFALWLVTLVNTVRDNATAAEAAAAIVAAGGLSETSAGANTRANTVDAMKHRIFQCAAALGAYTVSGGVGAHVHDTVVDALHREILANALDLGMALASDAMQYQQQQPPSTTTTTQQQQEPEGDEQMAQQGGGGDTIDLTAAGTETGEAMYWMTLRRLRAEHLAHMHAVRDDMGTKKSSRRVAMAQWLTRVIEVLEDDPAAPPRQERSMRFLESFEEKLLPFVQRSREVEAARREHKQVEEQNEQHLQALKLAERMPAILEERRQMDEAAKLAKAHKPLDAAQRKMFNWWRITILLHAMRATRPQLEPVLQRWSNKQIDMRELMAETQKVVSQDDMNGAYAKLHNAWSAQQQGASASASAIADSAPAIAAAFAAAGEVANDGDAADALCALAEPAPAGVDEAHRAWMASGTIMPQFAAVVKTPCLIHPTFNTVVAVGQRDSLSGTSYSSELFCVVEAFSPAFLVGHVYPFHIVDGVAATSSEPDCIKLIYQDANGVTPARA
jgi:hypothetical protein